MPELDGVTIIGLAAFAALVVAWLVAPSDAKVEAMPLSKAA